MNFVQTEIIDYKKKQGTEIVTKNEQMYSRRRHNNTRNGSKV